MTQIRTIKKAKDTGRLDRARVRSVIAATREGTPVTVGTGQTRESHGAAAHGLNTSGLIQRLASRVGMSREDAARAFDALFSVESGIIADALRSGDKVQITGFGSFEAKRREARKGRNPRTGKEIDLAASAGASFRVGKGLKDMLDGS
jgi:DNA-binding protein HU-beta